MPYTRLSIRFQTLLQLDIQMSFRELILMIFITWSPLVAGDDAARLDPNTASDEQLGALQHLSEAEITTILAARPFDTIGELDAVLGASLSAEHRAELYEELFVPIALNSASKADILLIPGVDNKMAREFEEYRPYKSMEQFRREIGKYVDEEEVARLESYVTLD
jgi:DNA uptake protein ComE-like DNA-binding protein